METIIIDDGSSKEHDVTDLYFEGYNIRVIRLERSTDWRGACVAYNTGFRAAAGDVILINSSECMHVGNVIGYINDNFKEDSYMAFSTLMGAKDMDIEDFNTGNPDSFLAQSKLYKTWWSVHSKVGNYIPYCAAINKKNMDILGGYDEQFVKGIGYDDYDFTHRVRNLGLKMQCIDSPFVFHQWHKPTDYPNTTNLDLLNKLNKEQPGRISANVAS
jgi:glycosyltransferase involved in cell wall biosynthesis